MLGKAVAPSCQENCCNRKRNDGGGHAVYPSQAPLWPTQTIISGGVPLVIAIHGSYHALLEEGPLIVGRWPTGKCR